jgi:hypothetical protein
MKTDRTGTTRARKTCGGLTAAFLVALALMTGPVYGQAPGFSPGQRMPTGGFSTGLPSENTAIWLSVIGSAAAVLSPYTRNDYAFLTCLTIGPSLGFFYGGCWGRGLLTSTLRLAATVATVAVSLSDEGGCAPGYIWLGTMVGTAILDIATVRGTVRRHNAALMARRGLKVGVSPFAVPKGGGFQVRLAF